MVHLSAANLVLIVAIFDLRQNAKSSRPELSVGRRELRDGYSGLREFLLRIFHRID